MGTLFRINSNKRVQLASVSAIYIKIYILLCNWFQKSNSNVDCLTRTWCNAFKQLGLGLHRDIAVTFWLVQLDTVSRSQNEQLEEEGGSGPFRCLQDNVNL